MARKKKDLGPIKIRPFGDLVIAAEVPFPNPGLGARVPAWGAFELVGFDTPLALTIGKDSVMWVDSESWLSTPPSLGGAYVRIDPPAWATDEQVERARFLVAQAGACAVRVLPRPRAAPMVREAREPARARETLREAVLAVSGGVASSDRAALDRVVEGVLGKVGL